MDFSLMLRPVYATIHVTHIVLTTALHHTTITSKEDTVLILTVSSRATTHINSTKQQHGYSADTVQETM